MRRFLLLLPLLLLTACVPSREEADSKLADACQAEIKATLDAKESITVGKASYAFAKSYDGAGLRVVTLDAKYTSGDNEPENKTYTCSYTEEWSFFSYLPEFYNLQKGDEKFGNVNGTITGDTNILVKINDATENVLH